MSEQNKVIEQGKVEIISIQASQSDDGNLGFETKLTNDKKDENIIHESMFGVKGKDTFHNLMNQVISGAKQEGQSIADVANAAMPILLDINPRDSLEGMLAVQMISAHNMAMEMNRRALIPEQSSEGVSENLNRAAKLMRIYTSQLETLQKYRSKGQQTIQVQHVNVESGSQVLVGNVNRGEG